MLHNTEHGCQWLKWLGEQVSGVADRMEDEQQQVGSHVERLLATTKELEKARAQIQSLEEELKRTKEYVVIMVNMGQQSAVRELVPPVNLQKESLETDAQTMVGIALEKDVE